MFAWLNKRTPNTQSLRIGAKELGLLASALSTAAHAQNQEFCGYPISLTYAGFENGEQVQYVALPPANTPLSLTVLHPAEGAVIGRKQVQVYGSYTGPANTGIVASSSAENAQFAATNATQFTTEVLQLEPGPQTITVRARTADGAEQVVVRNITIDPNLTEEIFFKATVASRFAPMRIPFVLSTSPPIQNPQITRYEIDYNGDGAFEIDAPTIGALSYYYGAPEVSLARARVTFDDAMSITPPVTREATFRVHIASLAYTRQTLCTVYYDMKHRLQATQISQAGNLLHPRIRPRFITAWTNVGAALPTIAGKLGDVVRGLISNRSAELTVVTPSSTQPAELLGFPIILIRDNDGVWRISKM